MEWDYFLTDKKEILYLGKESYYNWSDDANIMDFLIILYSTFCFS